MASRIEARQRRVTGAMKVAVFGATGGTGSLLAQGALLRNHELTALVRNRSKLEALDAVAGRARIIDGNALDERAVALAVAGQDAVLFALGPRTLAADPLLERAGSNVVAAMRQAGVPRLIVLGAAGSLRDSGKYLSAVTRLGFAAFKATILRNPMRMQARLQQIVESSGLEYTVVLPPRLRAG